MLDRRYSPESVNALQDKLTELRSDLAYSNSRLIRANDIIDSLRQFILAFDSRPEGWDREYENLRAELFRYDNIRVL